MNLSRDGRTLALHVLLALGGLGLAGWASLSGADKTPVAASAEPLMRCRGLQSATFTAGVKSVKVTWTGDEGVVEVLRPVGLPVGGVTQTEKLRMAGNQQLKKLKGKLSPPYAKRALGRLEERKRATLGLKDPQERLELSCLEGGGTLLIGASSYGGSGRYVALSSGETWLVDPTLVSDVRLADSRYVERRLVNRKRGEFTAVTVRYGGGARSLLLRNPRDIKRAEWVAKEAPERRDETYGNWMAKLMKLRAITWLPEGTKPPNKVDGKPVGTLLQVTVEGAEPLHLEVAGDAEGKSYWARSAATGGWVTLSKAAAAQLVNDAAGVVGTPAP